MADISGNMLKRPHPEDQDNNTQKRPRSNHGSPMPAQGAPAAGKVDIEKMVAEARAKAEAVRARLQAAKGISPSPTPAASSASPTPPAASPAMSRLEQMKARVAAATSRANAAPPQRPAPTPTPQPPPFEDEDDGSSRARGGLDVGLHPALLSDTLEFRGAKGRQTSQNKSRRTESPATAGRPDRAGLDLSGPSIEEIKNNPYFDPNLGPKATVAKPRQTRQLIFNQKGKYIQQAAALRRQAQLEAMKKRIAERARQAGIDEDLDVEKAFLVPAPPAIEWWDEGLVNGEDYSGIENEQNLKIDTPDSIITQYVQHPVLLDPPQEKLLPAQKPMYLTPKEQAKIRRQRRMADLKEQQAKIRLGLEPAPPPKVKKSNLMRVLGEQAVKDPTAVEARVNREIAERREKHETANAERKLTKEERREKLARQQEADAEKGIQMTVYRIDSLANGRNRFKISKNAEQNALTGVCVMHPRFNLVIVEGGSHSINNYRKLMMNRIDWTENAGPNAVREGNREAQAAWLAAEDEQTGELKDLSHNTCELVWEGQVKARAFRKWLGARVCETDSQAKDVLARAKLENFWVLAKSAKQNES
ncbi:U4/U6-U5 snRNP complex subunit PRP3 [Aspergillus vadensis CBS 113365]|uniref:U4/U6 small nuclear ribonucleo protein n=1 Tax=Aspergillus vadensis (strain CBS 113365 / IMI 142717 / IBT 24658) TaxID=1448311 RepID=A0A319AWX8_ASPVC|nr:U4/U6 small nuclear ribonucleo protein [Aspergillus vadensis CBS 113365]PYH64245.1 U4/U6 small nuclear ribonucleo protein [Aspergillus vadensis CBS 113365]